MSTSKQHLSKLERKQQKEFRKERKNKRDRWNVKETGGVDK